MPDGGSFADLVKLKGSKEIGDKINKIIHALADANALAGVIDVADFNDEDKLGRGQEMVDRLSKLVAIFEGHFYTPAEVSRVMAKLLGIGPHTRQEHSVYDPTCASECCFHQTFDRHV